MTIPCCLLTVRKALEEGQETFDVATYSSRDMTVEGEGNKDRIPPEPKFQAPHTIRVGPDMEAFFNGRGGATIRRIQPNTAQPTQSTQVVRDRQ